MATKADIDMRLRTTFRLSSFALLVLAGVVATAQTSSVTLTSSPATVTFPATVTLTVTVPAGTDTVGTLLPVTVTDTFQGITSTILSTTVPCCAAANPTFANVALAAGSHVLTATYVPNLTVPSPLSSTPVTVLVSQGTPTVTWPTPASIVSGTPLGSNQLDATANVPGTFTYNPPSGTVLPVGVQALTVTFAPNDSADYVSTQKSVNITISLPPPIVTFQGPSTSASGQQPAFTFTMGSFPTAATATFTLTFASSISPAVDDPSIQFSSGGRTVTVQIPANAPFSTSIALQTGTVAGTITVKAALRANGTVITPSSLAPVVIQVPPGVPVINSVTLTPGTDSIQVAVVAYSNTRETVQAEFRFAAAAGQTLQTTDVIIPADQLFSAWFQSPAAATTGGAFLYTQPFTLSGSSGAVGSVSVTLTNTQGASLTATTQ
jgi:hypothetical protein